MRYSNLAAFKADIRAHSPAALVERWLSDGHPGAFGNEKRLNNFAQKISNDYPKADRVIIAGTANWHYSLNPYKSFAEFRSNSDIDVVLISPSDFEDAWSRLRHIHRKKWYSWNKTLREEVMRTGQNVYCGFLSPKHIPDKSDSFRFEFLQRCNSYSNSGIDYREVNMMFFKSLEDVIDYYVRGVRIARSKV